MSPDGLPVGTRQAPRSVGPKSIALNLDQRSFFGLPGRDFVLNAASPSAVLPFDLAPVHKRMIRLALDRGDLVLGDKPYISDKRNPDAMEPFLQLIRTKVKEHLLITHVKTLMGSGDNVGGYTRYQVLENMQQIEIELHGRKDILNLLQKAKDLLPGPTTPVDTVEASGPRKVKTGGASASGRGALTSKPNDSDLDTI
jgi:hypothetical protein